MLNKQDRSKSTKHSPLAIAWPFERVAHFHRSDIKQTPPYIICDWFISNSMLKDDVRRWMSKDSRYAHNTESSYKNHTISLPGGCSIEVKTIGESSSGQPKGGCNWPIETFLLNYSTGSASIKQKSVHGCILPTASLSALKFTSFHNQVPLLSSNSHCVVGQCNGAVAALPSDNITSHISSHDIGKITCLFKRKFTRLWKIKDKQHCQGNPH